MGMIYVLGLVVLVNGNVGLASATADLDRSNLFAEPTALLSVLSLLVAANAVVVLLLSREAVVGSAFLSCETHVLALVGIGKTVLQDRVDQRLVTKLCASAHVREVVRGVGHGLGATSNNDIGSTSHDSLSAENNGLGGGSADLVDSGADDGLGKTSAEGALARGVLTKATSCQRSAIC